LFGLLALFGRTGYRGSSWRLLLLALFLLDFDVQFFESLKLHEKEVSDCFQLTVQHMDKLEQHFACGRQVGGI
jgi:hypothetical protein